MPEALAIFSSLFTVYNTFTMYNEPFTLERRTLEFSKSVLSFCKDIKPTDINRPLIFQLTKSATSIRANYAEANNASSKSDFRNKIFIAKKEAAETKYWLLLLENVVENTDECKKISQECQYILMTLQKIISTIDHGKQKTHGEQ
jgi:four helix bundle protein